MLAIDLEKDVSISHNSFPNTLSSNGTISPVLKGSHAIVWIKKGEGVYSVDFRKYTLRSNTIVLISKDQATTFDFSDDESDFVVITFPPSLVAKSAPEIQQLVSFCIREHFEGKQILKTAKEDEIYLETLVKQLSLIQSKWRAELRTNSMFHFLQLFLLYCHKLRQEQSKDNRDTYTAIVANFTNLLEKNFRSTHKVNYYTDNLNLTYNSLARYTSSYCSKTPKEIIAERVVLEIKRLLAGTTLPVKEIAFQLGFDEPTNLVKYFRKHTGITPSAFRGQR